jgi:hypothetical protein
LIASGTLNRVDSGEDQAQPKKAEAGFRVVSDVRQQAGSARDAAGDTDPARLGLIGAPPGNARRYWDR